LKKLSQAAKALATEKEEDEEDDTKLDADEYHDHDNDHAHWAAFSNTLTALFTSTSTLSNTISQTAPSLRALITEQQYLQEAILQHANQLTKKKDECTLRVEAAAKEKEKAVLKVQQLLSSVVVEGSSSTAKSSSSFLKRTNQKDEKQGEQKQRAKRACGRCDPVFWRCSMNNPLAQKDAPGRTSHRVQF